MSQYIFTILLLSGFSTFFQMLVLKLSLEEQWSKFNTAKKVALILSSWFSFLVIFSTMFFLYSLNIR